MILSFAVTLLLAINGASAATLRGILRPSAEVSVTRLNVTGTVTISQAEPLSIATGATVAVMGGTGPDSTLDLRVFGAVGEPAFVLEDGEKRKGGVAKPDWDPGL